MHALPSASSLRRIPFHGCLSTRDAVRNVSLSGRVGANADGADAWVHYRARCAATEVAFRRGQHADVPVLGDDRRPVSRKVDRGEGLR